MIRKIAERLSRGKIFKRRLPLEFGRTPFYLSPDAQLKYLKLGNEAFSPQLLQIAKEEIKPNSIVWDLGANVGVFSFAAASIAKEGMVLAIEPDIWMAGVIKKSTRLHQNRRLNIHVLPSAVSDRNGTASFLIAERGRANNTLENAGGRSQMGGVREKVIVPTLTLDTLLEDFDAPDFIKIDVEGAELMVLNGGKKLLDKARPVLYTEVGVRTKTDMTKVFKKHEYVLFDGSVPKQERKEIDECAYNTLAFPREMAR